MDEFKSNKFLVKSLYSSFFEGDKDPFLTSMVWSP